MISSRRVRGKGGSKQAGGEAEGREGEAEVTKRKCPHVLGLDVIKAETGIRNVTKYLR